MSHELRDDLIALTCDLVRFPSIETRPEQLVAVTDYLAGYLARIPGLRVERSEAGGKPALVATLRETRRPALMLNGHVDVVAAREEQFSPQVRDGRVYGRGAQDMKGSVAVMLRLARDLAALESPPDVGFQFVTDEEIGGRLGTQRLCQEGWGCELMLCLEPTDMGICYEHKGGMWMELRLPGSPAHGSRPWAGLNPTYALMEGLAELTRRFPPPAEEAWRTTVTPTVIQMGGGSRNQIPPSASLVFDIRFVAEDDPEELRSTVAACFPGAELVNSIHGAGLRTDPDHPEVQRLAGLITARTGSRPRFYREHFATDARFYSHIGVPAVCVGPVGAGLHSDEEWVAADSLVDLYDVLRSFIL